MQKIKLSLIAGAVCCLALGGSVAGASQVLLTDNGAQETDVRETVEKQGDTWTCKRESWITGGDQSYPLISQGPCTVPELGRAYEKLRSWNGQDPRILEADLMNAAELRDHYKKLSEEQSELLDDLTQNGDSSVKQKVERLKSRLSGPSRTGR
ncbi:hypothetical protein [Corynebacterium silvaticum]|uniref:Secreted protein n=1 Tax=Corynebacterium silvaticum TaxID=2320431 RepID=A0A7Y4LI58_9CORY|nr:hypothetical protein [Corynebacterium silvaticum]ARU45535.1 hypothetical protein CBE74_02365 [Corynebacterium silvaticum]MBH5300114.1 hypothetical protein [Corynebacterium silvaticum]NOM65361.1 hypothetical protein [Corynebacterium silvaticum]NON70519.1 hypothetical protein [Corynebacterium silvaticum]TFA92433.1 hypothetical protein EU802_07210 [Corynebacterium silvaticum]